jgi:hypothetical protein
VVLLPAEPGAALDGFEAEQEPHQSPEAGDTPGRLEPAEP